MTGLAFPQTRDLATLRGHISDPMAAAIPDATITLENRATGLKRTVRSDAAGDFLIAGLPLTGRYVISVSHAGFETTEKDALELGAGETVTIDFRLNVAAGQSAITVYGAVDGVRTDSAQAGVRLDLQQIENTPVLGRKLSSLPLLDSAVRPRAVPGICT